MPIGFNFNIGDSGDGLTAEQVQVLSGQLLGKQLTGLKDKKTWLGKNKNAGANLILLNAAIAAQQEKDRQAAELDRQSKLEKQREDAKITEKLREQVEGGRALIDSGVANRATVPFSVVGSPQDDLSNLTPEQRARIYNMNIIKHGANALQSGFMRAIPENEAAVQEAVNQLAQRKAAAPLMSKIGGARAISDLFGARTSTQANKNRLLNLQGREPFESRIGEQGGQSDLQQTLTDLATGKEKEFTSNQNLGIARKLGGLKETTAELKARQEAGDIQDALDQAKIARGVTSSPEGQDLQRKIIASKLQSTLFQNRNLPLTSNYYQDITGGSWMNPAYSAFLQSKVKADPMEAANSLINQQRALKGLPPLPNAGGLRRPVPSEGSGNTMVNPETGEVIYFNP